MEQIKKLAEDALKLQNKLCMETALKEIVAICESYPNPIKEEVKTEEDKPAKKGHK